MPVANIEAVKTVHVLIDKTAPTAVALANASVKRGALATLRFKLADNVSPTCDVKLLIKTAKGKLVKTVPVLGEPTTPTPMATFSKLRAGQGQVQVVLPGHRRGRQLLHLGRQDADREVAAGTPAPITVTRIGARAGASEGSADEALG